MRHLLRYSVLPTLLLAAGGFAAVIDLGTGSDQFDDVAADSSGNSYVVTEIPSATQGPDLYVASYDSAGALRWSTTYHSPTYGNEIALRVFVQGGVVSAAFESYAVGLGTPRGVGTLRLDATTGAFLSDDVTPSAPGKFDGLGACISASGTVHIGGLLNASGNVQNAIYSHASPNPGTVVTRPGDVSGAPVHMTAHSSGIYMAGMASASGQYHRTFVAKFDPATLTFAWVIYLSSPNGNRIPCGISHNLGGEIFVGGTTDQGGAFDSDFYVAKISQTGVVLAETAIDSGNSAQDQATCFGMLGGTTPVIAGRTGSTSLFGAVLRTNLTLRYPFIDQNCQALHMSVDANAAYLAGTTFGGTSDTMVMKVGQTGIFWKQTYSTGANQSPSDIRVTESSVFVSGASGGDAQLLRIDPLLGGKIW